MIVILTTTKMSRRSFSSRISSENRLTRSFSGRNKDKSLSKISLARKDDPTTIASEIMGEIVDKAMDEIYKIYLEKQTVKFVVHCAHEALTRLVRFHFYRHNDYQRDSEFWGPDCRVPPSPPDSWGVNQVDLYQKITADTELNTVSKVKLEIMKKCADDDCKNVIYDEDVDKESIVSQEAIDDMGSIVESIVDSLALGDRESIAEDLERKMSNFTLVAEGVKSYEEFKMKPHFSKISVLTSVKKPKHDFELPNSITSKTHDKDEEVEGLSGDEEFPYFRNCARYKAHLDPPSRDKAEKK